MRTFYILRSNDKIIPPHHLLIYFIQDALG